MIGMIRAYARQAPKESFEVQLASWVGLQFYVSNLTGAFMGTLLQLYENGGWAVSCGRPQQSVFIPGKLDDDGTAMLLPEDAYPWSPPCECGSAAVGSPFHADYCPLDKLREVG